METTEKKAELKKHLLAWGLPIGIAVVIALAAVIGASVSTGRLAASNQALAETNEKLLKDKEAVEQQLTALQNPEVTEDKTFSYLAIGNSITQHPVIDDLWWGEWGMAASDEEHDYYHLVCDEIDSRYAENETTVLNFRIWEEPPYNREDMLKYLKGYVTEDLDLITVMLGDNVKQEEDESDTAYRARMETDYKELIAYLQENAPDAEIVMVGCFWEDIMLDSAIQNSCEELRVPFISLVEIQGEDYRAGQWADVEGGDDNEHLIVGTGAAEHPNDDAMQYIADRIIEYLPE